MAAKSKNYLMWDENLANKARTQHKYVFVFDGQKQRTYKVLSGAENAWVPGKNKQPTLYIYIPDKRLMGLKDAVVAALKAADKSDAEIKTLLKSAYTKDNHGADYQAELQKLNEYRHSEKQSQKDKIKYGLDDIEWFIAAIKNVKEEPIDKLQKNAKVSPKGKREIFRSLLQKAQDNKQIIDVSALETSGAKIRTKSNKNTVHSDALSYIESDNVKSYRKAMEWAFGSADDHESDIESVKSRLAEKKKAAGQKVKGTTKKTTPKKVVADTSVSVQTEQNVPSSTVVVEKPAEKVADKPAAKKKQLGSPKKAALPGSKSPGAILTRGGDNFQNIPPLPKGK
ncbi:MAG TPA: hypothetical protein VLG50_05830 [Candidatus Saccharimonadales bacterium]|nr:hypothetical protein [Candidatus Saccharimonadales bacterium]